MSLSPLSTLNSWGAPTLDGLDTSNPQIGQRIGGKSNRQYVKFYTKKFLQFHADKVKINEKTGTTTVFSKKPVEVEKLMVHVVTPGDKNEVNDVACDFHKREFWAAYQAFLKGTAAPIGQSLDECEFINTHVATELRHMGCHTVEQLADASDQLCNMIPNGQEAREMARLQCKANIDNKSLEQVNLLKAENSKLLDRMTKLEAMISGGNRIIEPSSEVAVNVIKKAAGRPKKIITDITE